MWKRISKKRKTAVNLLDLVPQRVKDWETEPDGRVVVLQPRFEHPFLERHLLPRMSRPYFRVRLDQYGTAVWLQIDGLNSVRRIGELLQEQYGQDVEPIFQRLGLFVQQLDRARLIRLMGWPGEPAPGDDAR
jgi:hypothetical protein